MSEKRKEQRSPVMVRVQALWEDEAGTAHVAPATMEDRSPHGANIRINIPIGVGRKLTIKSRVEQFSGTVMHSSPDKQAFILGIQRDAAEQIPLISKVTNT